MVLSLVRVRDRPFLLKGVGDELLLLEGEGGKLLSPEVANDDLYFEVDCDGSWLEEASVLLSREGVDNSLLDKLVPLDNEGDNLGDNTESFCTRFRPR